MKKILVFMALVPIVVFSQDYYDDAQLWMHLNMQTKIGDRVLVQLNFQGRAINNMMVPGRGAVDFGLGYKFSKNVKVIADYTYIQRVRNNGSYRTYHRANLSLFLKKDFARWSFVYRNKLQARAKSFATDHDNYILYFYDRNKFLLRYELNKRLSFYGYEELYIPLNDPNFFGISRTRSALGTLINVTKKQQIELYFMYQQQIQPLYWFNQDISYRNTPLKRYFVYGIGYNIQF
jgi:hypothetical protein